MVVLNLEALNQRTKQLRYILLVLCLGLTAFGSVRHAICQQTGTLVLALNKYTLDTKMPKKYQKALEHGGIPWAMLDNTVLISLVERNSIKADIPYLTRFGEQKSLEVKPGQYTITCIGYEFKSTSSDLDKVLTKSAFFNIDVVKFAVLPGKTTVLDVSPTYKAESQWKALSKFKMFIPEIRVHVLEDGIQKGEDVVVNRRTSNSVAWDDYHGPLKF